MDAPFKMAWGCDSRRDLPMEPESWSLPCMGRRRPSESPPGMAHLLEQYVRIDRISIRYRSNSAGLPSIRFALCQAIEMNKDVVFISGFPELGRFGRARIIDRFAPEPDAALNEALRAAV